MKHLPILLLFVSFSVFAGKPYDFKGYGSYGTSPQERHRIETQIHNERVQRQNIRSLNENTRYNPVKSGHYGHTPRYETETYNDMLYR